MLALYSEIQSFKVASSLRLQEIWLNSQNWHVSYLVFSNANRVLPLLSSLCQIQPSEVSFKISSDLLERLESVSSVEEFTLEKETQLLNRFGISSRRVADVESEHRDYTSVIQSTAGGSLSRPTYSSDKALRKFRVDSSTGPLGQICDFVCNTVDFSLAYFLVSDAKMPERKILVDPEWIEGADFKASTITVGLSRETILLEAVYNPNREPQQRYRVGV